MESKNDLQLYLKGLDCANCGLKIEAAARAVEGVSAAQLDFVSRKLHVKIDGSGNVQQITAAIGRLAAGIENGVEIVATAEAAAAEAKPRPGLVWVRLGGAALFFGVAQLGELTLVMQTGLFLAAYLLAGVWVLWGAAKNIFHGRIFDENFLMSIATLGALAIGEFPEAVAVMLFYEIGEILQSAAVGRSRRSIEALLKIRPEYATVKRDGKLVTADPAEVMPGDVILIKPGEKVPLDGQVIEGQSMLDVSNVTGESVPQEAGPGDEVLAGTINQSGLLTVQVTRIFNESAVAQILELVQNAGSKKARTENFITKFAGWYTPLVVAVAALLAVLPPLLVPGAVFSEWLYRALVFLVISCPCALVISIPLGFFGGIGAASKRGILFKGSGYLEALSHIKTVVFDKTGTLTKGTFRITSINCQGRFTKAQMLEMAAYAECYAGHPLALALRMAYGEIDESLIEEYEEVAGAGVKVRFRQQTILAGSRRLMAEAGFAPAEVVGDGSAVHLAVDDHYAGYILLEDEVKPNAAAAVSGLRQLGVSRISLLTGDRRSVGEKIAAGLGVDDIHAELLPQQKVMELERILQNSPEYGRTAFVGDGVNDAPALARADIGIAMGAAGAAAAIEAADVILMTDNPESLLTAVRISRRTQRIIWQNIILALGVKALVMLLGVFGLANMWEAVFADVGVTLLAVGNSLRALNTRGL